MKTVRKIISIAIQDNKLLMIRLKGGNEWSFVEISKGNWQTEERALTGKFQKEIGCPVEVLRRIGDFKRKDSDISFSAFQVELKGPIFVRNQEIEEWRYMTREDATRIDIKYPLREEVIPACVKAGILKW
ncbi:MAG: NUDIX domain-containing protein [Candidatus Paceibacterota bacterium]|jgi:hypothetical protein